ncbi:MAG TPA: hypothetical protein PLK32_08860 [Defluviitoga tunisiensis]|nr:hypothetical protein [Defluviitoga tunisiensis]
MKLIQIITHKIREITYKDIIGGIGILLILLVPLAVHYHMRTIVVEIDIKMPARDMVQLFYKGGSGYYTEENSVVRQYEKEGQWQELYFEIPQGDAEFIRIDPGTRAGEIRIRKICFKDSVNEKCFSGGEIRGNFRPLNQIEKFDVEGDELKVISVGNDPHFEIEDSLKLLLDNSKMYRYYGLYVLVVGILAIVFILFKKPLWGVIREKVSSNKLFKNVRY